MISLVLSIVVFLINGVGVLRFYQIKDYLYSRVIAHFYLPSSKKLIFNKKEYLVLILLFLSLFFKFNFLLRPDFLIFLIVLLFALRINLIKKIHFTPKAILISFLAFLINFIFLFITENNSFLFFLLSLWISQFIVFTAAIGIFDILVKPYLLFLGKKVKNKIEKIRGENPNFKIIGIVGSYGKSSTKEFLTQFLKGKYKVLTTPPRINHEYALLKFLLKAKMENYDYLILEFGSYYLGNVKWITKYITPHIAYITGTTKQHLFLFRSIENIIQGEGLEILTWIKKGILFINNNHEYFELLENKYRDIICPDIKTYTYGKDGDFSYKIKEINLERSIFEFTAQKTALTQNNKNRQKIVFETNIIFPMQIENLVGALSYIYLIDDIQKYRERIKNLELPEGFLKLKKFNHIYLFDDSYNANPRGVFEGINFFKTLNFDYKVIIFNGLLELGKETKEIYKNLAQEFLAFDKIILTSDDFYDVFKEVLKEKVLLIKNSRELEIFLQSLKFNRVGIWIFNRLPERIKLNLK
ncbi:MAG: hypothetical protein KatS3mg096_178 [Candidatus Parcubacteria bacterium]|nr:MAG: hypothetical protein KatS3mg093_414 [Candidatus Parcubacteria bacterium]GIW67125.1 MAG: hypothetical protein KatS3mg095_1023 [Candidatus Parcubacteria bacterium]GIW67310.1 MAG: hypothetical protein KatS3mg096_178 [Candidatus Parcubacteria bacterium]